MEAIKLLKRDHARLKTLFDKFEQAGDRSEKGKQDVFDQVYAEIDIHSRIEEELFYPFVKTLHSKELEDMVAESIEEHLQIKRLLSELKSLSPKDEQFDAKMKVLSENIQHHAEEEEEGEMFPLVQLKASLEHREELGKKLEERKDVLQKGWTGVVADWFRSLIPQTEA